MKPADQEQTDRILAIVAELTVLKMFPAEDAARLAIAKQVCSMADNEDQIQWLVDRTIALSGNEWRGVGCLRQIFCSKFMPADGIRALASEYFPDGVPSEKRLEFPALPALPAGAAVSALPGLDRAVARLARAKSLDRVKQIAAPAPTNPGYKPVTQADVERELQKLRDQRAKDEAGL